MKQAIDFDFDEAINNYNDKYNFIKQSKYDIKHNWLLYIHSILFSLPDYFYSSVGKSIGSTLFIFGGAIVISTSFCKYYKKDYIKDKGQENLQKICFALKKINVDTDFRLVKDSRLDGKKLRIRLNERKIPQLVQSKYIIVPSYDYKGEETETSVLQEHAIFSKQYVLSKSRESKQKKPVLSFSAA